jgi:hypothetical protein
MRNPATINHFPPTLFSPNRSPIYGEAHFFCRNGFVVLGLAGLAEIGDVLVDKFKRYLIVRIIALWEYVHLACRTGERTTSLSPLNENPDPVLEK